MRNALRLTLVIAFLLLGVGSLWRPLLIRAQVDPQQPHIRADQQKDEFPTSVNLNCAGCHGPGKTLPNLGGEQFHKDVHAALDTSVHAMKKSDGAPIASCKTCHARNGDMTTVLAASDPRSTINRANIAETCGQCHGDKYRDWRVGIHGKRVGHWDGARTYLLCVHCHNPHSPRFKAVKPEPRPARPEEMTR